jgi:hypothetical protein
MVLAARDASFEPRRGLSRTLDGGFLTEVANHPDVRPWLGGTPGEKLDLLDAVRDPQNIALQTASGGFICLQVEVGVYDVHSLFLPGIRRKAVSAMRASLEYVFCRTNCVELRTMVPANNKAADGLARLGGFQERFMRTGVWPPRVNGPLIDVSYRSLSLERWALQSPATHRAGRDFHAQLEAAKRASGSSLAVHPDDAVHDHMAGAVVLLARGGTVDKGVDLYNRWLGFAGYERIALVTASPPVLDIGDAVLGLDGDEIDVLLCRGTKE